MKNPKPGLVVGAGSFACAIAAVKGGADAVYFGIKGYNMRDLGTNFSEKEMKKLVSYLHKNKVKAYLALNTIVFEEEFSKVKKILARAKKSGVDAVICSDLGVMSLAKKAGLRIHLSTQASTANSIALEEYKKLGAKRIVLARELSLKQIKKISQSAKKLGVEIECFVHGAMCIAVSGRCFMSHELFGRSANRGECLQVCRRAFFLDGHAPDFEKKEILVQGSNILSAKDLKTIEFLDKIIGAGVGSLKIEGRTKPADYISAVTKCYREAIDSVSDKSFSKEKISDWDSRLSQVYNRGFSSGFYFGVPGPEGFAEKRGSSQTTRRTLCGVVEKYYSKIGVAEVKVFSPISIGDRIVFEGTTTFFEQPLSSMQIENESVERAKKGMRVGIKTIERTRANDRLFVVKEK